MADAPNLAKLVPGFDFLQGLVKNAGAALPSIGQWIAPTLNPEELEKRIDELRTVQFWLEQNARMLAATIQALEVQRMTLSTLKTMNVQMGDLRDSLQIRMPGINAPLASAPSAASDGNGKGDAAPAASERPAARKGPAKTDAATAAPGPGAVDPLQWWGALTKQFTQLAADAMKESAADAAKNLAGSMMKQSFDAAARSLQGAMPGAAAKNAASASPAPKSASAAPAAARNASAPPAAAKKEAAPRKRAAPRRAG